MRFGRSDADAWYKRNKDKLGQGEDPVLKAVQSLGLKPGRVLEFGCANGWRLICMKEAFQCDCWGVEISSDACRDADQTKIVLNREPAIVSVDLVIFGFCLYVIHPSDIFRYVYMSDAILKDGGHLVVHDFMPSSPCSRIFEHNTELLSRKMDYSRIWTSYPSYRLVCQRFGDDGTAVSIIRKDIASAFPLEEVDHVAA